MTEQIKEEWKYWKKGDSIRIVCNRKQMLILPKDAKVTYEALKELRLNKNNGFASNSTHEDNKNNTQTFAHELLNEHTEKDAEPKIKTTVDDILGEYKPKRSMV